MKKIILFLVLSIFLTTSCCKEDTPTTQTDENGVVISKPYIWKTSLHLSEPVSNSGISAQVYYNGNFLSPITDGGNNRKLAMIDSDNGDILWQWDDRFQPETEYMDICYYHKYNNLFTYQKGTRSYCINLDNGTTHWKQMREISYTNKINSFGSDHYFNYGPITNNNGYTEFIAFKGNVNTGELVDYLSANFSFDYVSPSNLAGSTSYIIEIPNSDNLLVNYTEPLLNSEVNSFLGLYNSETEEWIYERKLMASPAQNTSVFTPPKIYNDKIYANVGNYIVCHDLDTGEQLWSKSFTGDFMFSGFIIEDNKLIGCCENETLYCLNPETGSIIWQTAGSGTSSRLAYLNGIVYFSGGGDGKLHGVDVTSGETVWKLNASNIDGSAFAGYNPVYVLPAEGNNPARVFAHTFGNVVCYEAYQ
jgi:outer membrane protein assembly factor BamB